MASTMDLSALEKDPRLFLYTSLTSGSSHIITATSRMETILKANKVPFQAIDTATDEKARRLWQRRAGGRKLPGLVKEGFVIGDLNEVEEWNEYGELQDNIGPVPEKNVVPPGGQAGVNIAPPLPVVPIATGGTANIKAQGIALPGAAEIAAKNKAQKAEPVDAPPKAETISSAPAQKEESINVSKKTVVDQRPAIDHLSAPTSRIHSGTATPVPQASDVEATKGAAEGATAVEDAPVEETKAVESEGASKENDEDDSAAKGVEGLQVSEGMQTQEQDAKEAEDAGKSVED